MSDVITKAMRRPRTPRSIAGDRDVWYYVDSGGVTFYGDTNFRLNRHEIKRIAEIMDGGK